MKSNNPIKRLPTGRQGFTLVEIMVVMAIIALLAVIAIRTLSGQINKANDAKRKSDLQRISIAFEDYYSDEDCYPIDSIISECGGGALKDWGLASIPCDPVYHTPYCYIPTETPECSQKYRLLGTLKYLQDKTIKELGCDGNQYCGWETECEAAGNRNGFNYGVTSSNTSILNSGVDVVPGTTPTPVPTSQSGTYACAPDLSSNPPTHAHCNSYPSAQQKGCSTFTIAQADSGYCQQMCDSSSSYWCY